MQGEPSKAWNWSRSRQVNRVTGYDFHDRSYEVMRDTGVEVPLQQSSCKLHPETMTSPFPGAVAAPSVLRRSRVRKALRAARGAEA